MINSGRSRFWSLACGPYFGPNKPFWYRFFDGPVRDPFFQKFGPVRIFGQVRVTMVVTTFLPGLLNSDALKIF